MTSETASTNTIPQVELALIPKIPGDVATVSGLQESVTPIQTVTPDAPQLAPGQDTYTQLRDHGRTDHANSYAPLNQARARLDAALEQGREVDTSFQWGDQKKSLAEITHENWLEQGAHLADFHWGNTVTSVADLPPAEPAPNTGPIAAAPAREVAHATTVEIPTAEQVQFADTVEIPVVGPDLPVLSDSHTRTHRVINLPSPSVKAPEPQAWYDANGRTARVQPEEASTPLPENKQGPIVGTETPTVVDIKAEQSPEAVIRHKRVGRVGKFLRKLKLVVDAPPEDEYLPGYGPRTAGEDDDYEQIIDPGYVELPNGGLSKDAYNALQAKNSKLPAEGVDATLRLDQREEAARSQIQGHIKAQYAEGEPAYSRLLNEVFNDVNVVQGELAEDYRRRIRIEFDHRVAERIFEATVDAGIPLTEVVNRDGQYITRNPQNPNDYRGMHEGGVRRTLRRAVNLGATALNLGRGLNELDALRAQGVVGRDGEEEF